MEYFKYFLYGANFRIITDHKALKALNTGEIKSLRIQRWLDRMSVFNFKIEYKNGKEIPHVDCFSRNVYNIVSAKETVMKNELGTKEKIRLTHEKLLHRGVKSVKYELQKEGIDIKNLNSIIQEEIKSCGVCKRYNPKKYKKFIFVTAYEVGEKFAVDIIGPIQDKYIIIGIDYFSRKGFAKLISKRKDEKIVEFLNEIKLSINIKMLILDHSKENLSNKRINADISPQGEISALLFF